LEQLNVQKAAIMGLSLGGRIAIDFAIAHPDRVSALILAAPGASGYDFEKDDALTENNELFDEALEAGDVAKAVEYFQRSWTDGPQRSPSEVDPEVRSKVKAMAIATLENRNTQSEPKELDPPAFGRLAEIRAPTLAIVGDLDMPSILDIVDRVEKDVSGAEVVVIPGVAHMVNMEKPELFNQAVLDFLVKH
jgi:pimeloyl-ACP methyl ester carboxylesterase